MVVQSKDRTLAIHGWWSSHGQHNAGEHWRGGACAGGGWLLWRGWAGWDGWASGGGHSTLLPRCLVNKRLHSLFMEFDLALGVGVEWLGVLGVGGVLMLVWRRGGVRRRR